MTKRKPLSKKARFDTFKRDGFICQYCGNTPPTVVLEVDHIHPVSDGGDNSSDNLITACFDCNRGKSNRSLTLSPETVAEKAKILEEKEEQLRAFKRIQATAKRRQTREVSAIEQAFAEYWRGQKFTDSFRQSIRVHFLPCIDANTLIDNMHKACMRCPTAERAVKYFCGTNWGMIKNRRDREMT